MNNEATFDLGVQFDYPIKVWVLQLGGWFPIQLSNVDIMLVDRNITSAISKIIANPTRIDMVTERWWLDHLNSEKYQLNSFFCALEGNTRGIPTFNEFCSELKESNAKLAVGIPKARLISHSSEYLKNLYQNVLDIAQRHTRETAFLIQIAPIIAFNVPTSNAKNIEKRIIEIARSQKLTHFSLVVIAALSCLYEPMHGMQPRIGRGVLKPKAGYSHADAYNALADLHSLEMLAAGAGITRLTLGFCTRDKYLASFWTHLNVSKPVWSGNNSFKFDLTPSQSLFPRLTEIEVSKLLGRLKE